MTDNTLTIKETHYLNGQIRTRHHYNAQGRPHNPTGPAYESWHENGQLSCQQFCINGVLHNPNGPTVQTWYSDGQQNYQRFWLNGEYLTEAEWKTQAKPVPVVLIDDVRYVPEH